MLNVVCMYVVCSLNEVTLLCMDMKKKDSVMFYGCFYFIITGSPLMVVIYISIVMLFLLGLISTVLEIEYIYIYLDLLI